MIKLEDLKPEEARTQLTTLTTVAEGERTEEQKKDIEALNGYVKEYDEYSNLSTKKEEELTDVELDKLIKLDEKYGLIGPEKKSGKVPDKEPPKPEAGKEGGKKKFAGIYDTVEDLLKGLNSSEEERKKITANLSPEDVEAIESEYKESQRKITRTLQTGKPPRTGVMAPSLEDRLLEEMTEEDYKKWQTEKPLEAQAWLTRATTISTGRRESAKKVYEKHPEFVAMMQGLVPASKEWIEFDKVSEEHWKEWKHLPNGPELTLAEVEKRLGTGKPIEEPKKTPPIKPSFIQGKGGAGSPSGKKKKLTTEEFEALSGAEQENYLASQNEE